jgi:hypothetical protein
VKEIHAAFVVVVVMGALGSIGRQEQVVRAETMALSVTVCKNAALQHLVVAVVDSRRHNSWGECKLLVLVEEVVQILVQHHASHWLQGEQLLGPDFGGVHGVEVILIFVIWVHRLDIQPPLWEAPRCNGVVEILGCMAVVLRHHLGSLLLQEELQATSRPPVPLDERLLALLVDQLQIHIHNTTRIHINNNVATLFSKT